MNGITAAWCSEEVATTHKQKNQQGTNQGTRGETRNAEESSFSGKLQRTMKKKGDLSIFSGVFSDRNRPPKVPPVVSTREKLDTGIPLMPPVASTSWTSSFILGTTSVIQHGRDQRRLYRWAMMVHTVKPRIVRFAILSGFRTIPFCLCFQPPAIPSHFLPAAVGCWLLFLFLLRVRRGPYLSTWGEQVGRTRSDIYRPRRR